MNSLLLPDWPAPATVKACSTLRAGGISLPPYDSLNLGTHVGDDPVSVQENRQRLVKYAHLPQMPHWLEQVHGTDVVRLASGQKTKGHFVADAVYSHQQQQVCAIMTADCLPVLFCSLAGDEVAAAHAGWRGLCAGILESTIQQFSAPPSQIMAWLGPAIGPQKFEVGSEVRDAFMAQEPTANGAFVAQMNGKYLADIYHLARLRLRSVGVSQIYGGGLCTVSDRSRFFSYRRDEITGRMASLIWLI
ncbi:purine nucleoside phosphorylase YfiH [Edaphovirga cremea]|jgi:YfiH family protein|uniref:purine nucleoside phosphorylase YfiH n=1 Tax=Edaphovirga cremea TaxID=2267246 RepID=UPI0039898BE0